MRIGETVFLSSGEMVKILTISLSAKKILVELPEGSAVGKGRKWVEYDEIEMNQENYPGQEVS